MEEQTDNKSTNEGVQNELIEASQQQAPKEGAGAFVGVVIIVIVLILGGLYFWGTQLNNKQQRSEENTLINSAVNDNIATPQDAPATIQTDFNKFNTTEFDAKLNADLNALNAAL